MDKTARTKNIQPRFCAVAGICALLWISGCSVSTRVTFTQRSAIEQQLLVRSLERALAKIDTEQFDGKSIALDVYGLTADREFAKEMMLAHLQQRGVSVASKPDEGELRLKVFVNVLGVDRGETLVGIPAFAAPVVNAPVPEIAFYKSVRNRGQAELQIFAFEGDSGDFAGESPVAVGNAKYDNYTVLIVINFNLDDLDEPADKDKDS